MNFALALCHQKIAAGEAQREWWFKDGNTAFGIQARDICLECPIKDDCLDYALVNRIEHGIWGGVFEQKRKKMRRRVAA